MEKIMHFTLGKLKESKEHFEEVSDLPIEDFVDWGGLMDIVDMSIKEIEYRISQKHDDNNAIERKDAEIVRLTEENEKYRLEVCRLYDKYCE
jgi:hypothetical protein